MMVSPEDYDWAGQFSWYGAGTPDHFYASRWTRMVSGKRDRVYLHRAIAERAHGSIPIGMVVDHINGDTLDNRRENIRIATKSQNSQNKKGSSNASSRYKGVHRLAKPYRAVIVKDGKSHSLGSFLTGEEAALAYDEAARRLFGPDAAVNFPEALVEDKVLAKEIKGET